MGKGKNYKNLNFNCKEDYLYAGNILIVRTYMNLKRYKRYRDELEKVLDKLRENNTMYIGMDEYEEWEDKQKNVSHNLLTCFVDDTSTGFSYVMLRRYLSRSEYAKLIKPLNEELEGYLKELRDVRNWTFHFAQSDFVAMKEVVYHGVREEFRQCITFRANPIVAGLPKLVNAAYMESLYLHMSHRIKIFEKLFDSMIQDYQDLLGEKVQVVEALESPLEYGGTSFMTAQLSMAMQKKKYDGTPESFTAATSLKR